MDLAQYYLEFITAEIILVDDQVLFTLLYMQVSWHPKKESHLAFGTDDGKVGILDILSSRCDFLFYLIKMFYEYTVISSSTF